MSTPRILLTIMDETAQLTAEAIGSLRREDDQLAAVITPADCGQALSETVTVQLVRNLLEHRPQGSAPEYAYGLSIGAMAIVPGRFWR